MAHFCGACGGELAVATRFCVHCGAPQQPGPAAHPAPPSQAPWEQPPAAGGRRKGVLVLAGVVLGVGAVLAGVVVGTRVLGSGSGGATSPGTSPQRQVVSPVTSEPTEAWTWRGESGSDGSASVLADGDLVVVTDSMTDQVRIVRLGADGEELWVNEDGVWTTGVDEDEDRVYVSTQWEGPGLAALDAGTGEPVWSDDERIFVAALDDGLVLANAYDDSSGRVETAVLDATGTVLWSRAVDDAWVLDGRVGIVDGTEVSAVAPRTGESEWSVETGLDLYEDGYMSAAVTTGLVAVSSTDDDEVVGLDPADGSQLWRERPGLDDAISVSPAGRGLVYTYEGGDSEAYEDGEVVFLGLEGIVERRPLDPSECCYSAFGFSQDGHHYVASDTDGVVYDEDLNAVAHFDGTLVPTSEGFYEWRNGELSYHLIDGTEKWARQVGDTESYLEVVPLDGRVLVAEGDTVTAYE